MTAFVYARRFNRRTGTAVGVVVIALFLGASTLVSLDYAHVWTSAPAGLLESCSLYCGLAWLGIVARQALAADHRSTTPTAENAHDRHTTSHAAR